MSTSFEERQCSTFHRGKESLLKQEVEWRPHLCMQCEQIELPSPQDVPQNTQSTITCALQFKPHSHLLAGGKIGKGDKNKQVNSSKAVVR